MDLFCEKCTLQLDKKYEFDLHLSSVHGVKIEVKKKPLICEENVTVQVSENDVWTMWLTIASNAIYVILPSHQRKV